MDPSIENLCNSCIIVVIPPSYFSSPKAIEENFPFIMMSFLASRVSRITTEDDNKEYALIYIENLKGKEIYHRVDFGSPRTKQIASQLGISYEDCILKYDLFILDLKIISKPKELTTKLAN